MEKVKDTVAVVVLVGTLLGLVAMLMLYMCKHFSSRDWWHMAVVITVVSAVLWAWGRVTKKL
jgi:hypothetical protein